MNPRCMSDLTPKETQLPYVCPDHPGAQIRHSWDRTQCVLNGYPAGLGIDSNHRYECAECGRELAPEKQ